MKYFYCPKCGSPLTNRLIDAHERLVCTQCAFIFYQNSKPCVGALIMDQGKLLLVKRAKEPYKDYWDIPGGFLEAGEHPEIGVLREIHEETGLVIQLENILGIYMDTYGDSGEPVLVIFYSATVIGGQARAGSDATHLHWFDLSALPEQIAFESAEEVLALLRNGHKR